MIAKNKFSIGFGLILFSIFFSSTSFAENTRATYPNAAVLEVGGRGIFYSLGFDRVLNDHLAAGIGLGFIPTELPDHSAGSTVTEIPVYVNFYFSEAAGSLFLTAGATLIPNYSTVNGLSTSLGGLTYSSNPLQVTGGLGYEYRSDTGFLFRITGYAIYAKSWIPWGGFSLGYSF